MTADPMVEDVQNFLEMLDGIMVQASDGPVHLAMTPTTTVEEAAEYARRFIVNTAENHPEGNRHTIWGVLVVEDSPPIDPETMRVGGDGGGVMTCITGNGPHAEANAVLYTVLHNAVPFIRGMATELIRLKKLEDDLIGAD